MVAELPTTTASGGGRGSTLTLFAEDVTGTYTLEAPDVPYATEAGAVARTLADRMGLPQNVPWTLRNDRSGQYLEEEVEIGRQIEPGAKVTVTPRTHLG
jgi:hypothetical protein